MKRRPIVIVGSGGHARVVAALVRDSQEYELRGFVGGSDASVGERIGDSEVISAGEDLGTLRKSGYHHVALAIGDNQKREGLFREAIDAGLDVVSLTHPTAFVDPTVRMGRGVVVCPGAIVMAEATIGDDVLINTGARVDHECRVGPHAHVAPGSVIAGRVDIGTGTFIGAGATIIDRLSVGSWCVIGAGSVVLSNVPDGAVAVGAPARLLDKSG